MMEAVRTSETSVDNHSTRQYNPEDSSEHHTRHRENLKSHKAIAALQLGEQPRTHTRVRSCPNPNTKRKGPLTTRDANSSI
jgi:hypothetical protein